MLAVAFTAKICKMLGEGISFLVATTSGPIFTKFGPACFDYFPNVRNVLTCTFFLEPFGLANVRFACDKAFILVDNHCSAAFTSGPATFVFFEITFITIVFSVAKTVIKNI